MKAHMIQIPVQEQVQVPRYKSVVDTLNELWVERNTMALDPALADRVNEFERQMADLVMARDAVRTIVRLQKDSAMLNFLKEEHLCSPLKGTGKD